GLGWLIAHYFLAARSEFGEVHHISEPWWLRAHGAAAMGFLVVLGSLVPQHIVRAWRIGRNRWSGSILLVLVIVMVSSAYGLYYVVADQVRLWLSALHWISGIIGVAAMITHLRMGRLLRQPRRLSRIIRGKH